VPVVLLPLTFPLKIVADDLRLDLAGVGKTRAIAFGDRLTYSALVVA
jgi:hypothetical protein